MEYKTRLNRSLLLRTLQPSTSWLAFFLILTLTCGRATGADIPQMGSKAPDFTLKSLDGTAITLSKLAAKGNVVLVMLRGWPGYQCPICDRQVRDFIGAKDAFVKAGARVVFVYPGPAADLTAHAAEFKTMKGREWPVEFEYVLDPDYSMTLAYGLRWEAARETAYPSTFIVDSKGVMRFQSVSRSHGGRTKASEVIGQLESIANSSSK